MRAEGIGKFIFVKIINSLADIQINSLMCTFLFRFNSL